MTQEDFLKRLNLTPEKVSRIQELAKSLEDFDKHLEKTAPKSHGAFTGGIAESANHSVDLIARMVPELPRKEVEDQVSALVNSGVDGGSTSTTFPAITHFIHK